MCLCLVCSYLPLFKSFSQTLQITVHPFTNSLTHTSSSSITSWHLLSFCLRLSVSLRLSTSIEDQLDDLKE